MNKSIEVSVAGSLLKEFVEEVERRVENGDESWLEELVTAVSPEDDFLPLPQTSKTTVVSLFRVDPKTGEGVLSFHGAALFRAWLRSKNLDPDAFFEALGYPWEQMRQDYRRRFPLKAA